MNLNYKQIFLDFDGVISNTNELKKQNIYKASLEYISTNDAYDFCEYFTNNSGIPREKKTLSFFQDYELSNKILAKYYDLNKNLLEAPLIPGVIEFITLNKEKDLFILSGGDINEIYNYLIINQLSNYFVKIFSGPNTKEENLKNFNIHYPALFIGDSIHDYEVSINYNLDFIFLYGETQLNNWKDKLDNSVPKFKNFLEIVTEV